MFCPSLADGHSEKNTRGLLRSETDRNLTKSTVVIMDSLNFIKGYRYELWCLARSSGTRYCMVHVDTPTDSCVAWNAQRAGDKYSEEVMSDLLKRFERPDSRNRWDSPLFTVKPDHDEQHVVETVELVVSMILNKSGTSNTVKGILGSRHAKDLNPTVATTNTKLAGKGSYQCS
jgi:protein KTI12